jgi:diguanylate cyclase (GGDEF)-like protein/PAS domain S-box-containing protein
MTRARTQPRDDPGREPGGVDARPPLRVLLVEDNDDDATLLERALRRAWTRDAAARDARVTVHRVVAVDALREALEQDWDLVVTDHMLSGFTSDDVLAQLRARSAAPPCIIVSGRIGEQAAVDALHRGAQDYVAKDELHRLPAAVERALRVADVERASERALRDLKASEERYALAAAGANDGLWDADLTSGMAWYGPRWLHMLGLTQPPAETGLEVWLARVHPDDVARVRDALAQHLAGNTAHLSTEHRVRNADGSWRWVLVRGLAVRDDDGAPTRIAGSMTDISARKEIEAQLAHGALHDPLTGLPNRTLFLDRLTHALDVERRNGATAYTAVLLIDLDRFKVINDSLGHPAGDSVIVATARRLEAALRPGDTVARLGGDEFAMLLERLRSPREASRVTTRLLEALARPVPLDGREVYTSASIGIAHAKPGDSPADVIRDADTAMYRAKAAGKARHAVFDADMHARALALLQLETDLREAVEHGGFEVHYQPVVRLADGRLAGLEALLRWRHPLRGEISPARFVPLAEETGLIVPLGVWALRVVARQARVWVDAGLLPSGAGVAVNLSGRHLARCELVDDVAGALRETGLAPDRLHLELTETALISTLPGSADVFERLRALGVRVLLDDFGTGYSSLAYLHRFPVDGIKIDRSFIVGMHRAPRFVGAIVALANELGMTTTAEGVETASQARALARMGCTLAQGWHFARAATADETAVLLTRWRERASVA